MSTLEGVVTIVQESRFQLVDDGGVAHLLILGPYGWAEPDQLKSLARDQARVRVATRHGKGIIGQVATSITTV